MWRGRSQNTSTLITAPPRGQRSPNSFSVSFMGAWVYIPRLVMICQRAVEIWAYIRFDPANLIGFSGQTVLNLKNLFNAFYQAWPEDHVCQVPRWSNQIYYRRSILKVFDINQDGGKSIITQNNVIGCFELGLDQGFQWSLVCEYWTNGSKVMNMNACPTLTWWWR